jgi:hypothetical protein
MRSTKTVAAFVALFLAVSLGFVVSTSPATNAKAKEKHDLVAAGKEIGTTNKFKAFGKVSTYKGRTIVIQRKVNKQAYKPWKKIKTTADKGKFSTRIFGGKRGDKICYKVVVPATKKYKTTKDVVGCITTF